MLNPLIEHFRKELEKNPNALDGIEKAHSFDELKYLHDKYCIEEATILSETPNDPDPGQGGTTAPEPSAKKEQAPANFDNNEVPMDPMNRQNPHVRDYVRDPAAIDNPGQKDKPQIGGTPDLAEPITYEQAFRMPDGMPDEKDNKQGQASSGDSGQGGGPRPPKKEREPAFNPGFDDMSHSRKTKQTRRFARRITDLVCNLLEHGYVWYVTRDITESKLIQYELNDEMDLNLLVSLDGVQEQTVKAFFQQQCLQAKQDSKISDDDRDDLADALAEVMMEKGIAPTPTQNLIITGGEILLRKGIQAITAASQVTALLNQLREMKKGGVEDQGTEYAGEPQSAQQPQPEPQRPHPSQTVDTFGAGKDEVSMEIANLSE